MKTSISIESSFSAAHRLLGYPGNCSNIHGHTYRVIMRLSVNHEELEFVTNELGIMVDFKTMKNFLQNWLNINFDHAILLNSKDHKLIDFCKQEGPKTFVFFACNPTAENIAKIIFKNIKQEFTLLQSIRVYESPITYAEVSNA